jgi:hypothetical protein
MAMVAGTEGLDSIERTSGIVFSFRGGVVKYFIVKNACRRLVIAVVPGCPIAAAMVGIILILAHHSGV